MSVLIRRSRIRVGTFSARSGWCRKVPDEVGLVSGNVRQCRLYVETCSGKSVYCRDVFGEVGLVSGRFRRGRYIDGT